MLSTANLNMPEAPGSKKLRNIRTPMMVDGFEMSPHLQSSKANVALSHTKVHRTLYPDFRGLNHDNGLIQNQKL